MADVIVHLPYTPRRQFLPFHKRTQRWAIMVTHRRAGKTVAAINDVIRLAAGDDKKEGRYGFIAPFYNQAKDVAWSYLKFYAGPLLIEPPREAELSVLLRNGSRIRLYGGDNPDRLRGMYFHGLVMDEFGDMASNLWSEVLRPTLSDTEGWAVFIGTPKGKNQFWQVWNDAQRSSEWFTLMLKASETRLINAKELASIRDQMSPDEFAQEYLCSFEAAIKGAFYADEMRSMSAEQRIRKIDIDVDVRVHTSWDLGIADATAIVFWQCVGRERRIVDYYEASGVGMSHYVDVMTEKRVKYGWKYGDHYFPHDIANREISSGESRRDSLSRVGIEAIVVPPSNVLDGINAVRRMLGRTWIDSARCDRLIEALRQYRCEYDDKLKDFKKSPRHDWTSHGCDAVRMFAVGYDEPAFMTDAQSRLRDRWRERRDQGTAWSA
jgi:hypothetical protein